MTNEREQPQRNDLRGARAQRLRFEQLSSRSPRRLRPANRGIARRICPSVLGGKVCIDIDPLPADKLRRAVLPLHADKTDAGLLEVETRDFHSRRDGPKTARRKEWRMVSDTPLGA